MNAATAMRKTKGTANDAAKNAATAKTAANVTNTFG